MLGRYIFFLSIIFIFNSSNAQIPDCRWVETFGSIGSGANGIFVSSLQLDRSGNIYVGGDFNNSQLLIGNDTLNNPGGSGSGQDLFIAKFNSSGVPIWAKTRGGSAVGPSFVEDFAVDSNNNLYVIGSFSTASMSFDSSDIQYVDGSGYMAKFDSSGHLQWLKNVGVGLDRGVSIDISDHGAIYITGLFDNPYFIYNNDTIFNTGNYGNTIVVRIDGNGNILWAKHPLGHNSPVSVLTQSNGDVIIIGMYKDQFVAGVDTLNSVLYAGYVMRMDSLGNFISSSSFSGTSSLFVFDAILDHTDNLYITGYFSDTLMFSNDTIISHGDYDAFFIKYDFTGNEEWVNTIGSYSKEYGQKLTIDPQGTIYLMGDFRSPTLQLVTTTLFNQSQIVNPLLFADIFIVAYDSAGNELWANSIGGDAGDNTGAICADSVNLYVGGNLSPNAILFDCNLPAYSGGDFFVSKFEYLNTKISQFLYSPEVSVFPNPFIDEINILGVDGSTLQMFDITGNLLYELEVPQKEFRFYPNVATGVYYIKIIIDGHPCTMRVVKVW